MTVGSRRSEVLLSIVFAVLAVLAFSVAKYALWAAMLLGALALVALVLRFRAAWRRGRVTGRASDVDVHQLLLRVFTQGVWAGVVSAAIGVAAGLAFRPHGWGWTFFFGGLGVLLVATGVWGHKRARNEFESLKAKSGDQQ